MDVSIVIPSLNGYHLLKRLLSTITQFDSKKISVEILVVDNASQDKTVDQIKIDFPSVIFLQLQRNEGFSGAVNNGVHKAKGKFILLLNNDCIMELPVLEKLFNLLELQSALIATQPIIMTPQNQIEQIGYVVDLRKAKATVIKDKEYNFSQWNKQKDIFQKGQVYGLSATCLLIRKDIFEKVGMLDESFHSYLEDVDLFIRLAKEGYHFAPCLDATVVHQHMATSSRMGSYKEWHDLTNWIRIIYKNYPRVFIFNHFLNLVTERLRNFSGYMKKVF